MPPSSNSHSVIFFFVENMSEPDVDIVVVFPDGAKKKERAFTFPSITLVSDCLQTIIKKYQKYANKVSSLESDEQLNLILASKRLWLQTQQQIGSYEFPSQVRCNPLIVTQSILHITYDFVVANTFCRTCRRPTFLVFCDFPGLHRN
jgi:hypothetical protein